MRPFLVGPTGKPVSLGDLDLLTTSPTSRKTPAAARVSTESPTPVEASPAPLSVPQAAAPAEGSGAA